MTAPHPHSAHGILLRKARTAWHMFRTDGASAVAARLRAMWHARGGSVGNYARWIKLYDRAPAQALARMRAIAAQWDGAPKVSLCILDAGSDPGALKRTVRSLQSQAYSHWELCIALPHAPDLRRTIAQWTSRDARILGIESQSVLLREAVFAHASGKWITFISAGDQLPPQAIWHMMRAALERPDAVVLYADEDEIDLAGMRSDPNFKSDWNPELFLACGVADRTAWLRRSHVDAVERLGGNPAGTDLFGLQLRCLATALPTQVVHVMRVLFHAASHADVPTPESMESRRVAVEAFLKTRDWAGHVSVTPENRLRIDAQRTGTPLVSLIIPTRNQALLVRQCIDSILAKTTYPNYEILLIDNGSDDPEAIACFETYARNPVIRVIRDDRPFNYSALNNAAVRQSTGLLIGLVNNDIEVITPGWLDEMVALALRPGVGAVGAKLWYPDNRLQHGGVITGFRGVAGHAHWGLGRSDAGYGERAILPGVWSAVTAACLLVRRSSFDEVGGLDEANLAVAFNDVDFCLKLDAAGYRNVWTPYAELYHHESASRGQDTSGEKKARFEREVRHMHDRWGSRLQNDPYYNPNLCMEHDSFLLAQPPRIAYPM